MAYVPWYLVVICDFYIKERYSPRRKFLKLYAGTLSYIVTFNPDVNQIPERAKVLVSYKTIYKTMLKMKRAALQVLNLPSLRQSNHWVWLEWLLKYITTTLGTVNNRHVEFLDVRSILEFGYCMFDITYELWWAHPSCTTIVCYEVMHSSNVRLHTVY